MSHVFGSRPKAAETEAENATKKVPGRLNWLSPEKRGIFFQLMISKISFISIYEAKKHLSFLTVVIGVDRNVSEVSKYEIEFPSLSPRVFQVPYSISHNHLWKDGDDDDDNDVISESFQ